MISKELLSLVMGREIYLIATKEEAGHELPENHFLVKYKRKYGIINLDTLGRLCKEWCLTFDYVVLSGCDWHKNSMAKLRLINCIDDDLIFKADTELEAIIEATEWVAKEKRLKDEK